MSNDNELEEFNWAKEFPQMFEILFDKIFEIRMKQPEAEVAEFKNEIDVLLY